MLKAKNKTIIIFLNIMLELFLLYIITINKNIKGDKQPIIFDGDKHNIIETKNALYIDICN